MNKFCSCLWIVSLLIAANSCRYGKDYVAPTPDLPAPFSYKPATVQLAEVYWYDELRERYIYKNGRLSEQRNIVVTSTRSEEVYGIGYYDRKEGILSSYAYWGWPDIVWYEGGHVGTLKLLTTLTFDPLQGDSLRTATLSEPNRVALVKYGINPKGYITSEQGKVQGGRILLERNGQNNIIQVQYSYMFDPVPIVTTYEYDDHPNPFFAMGRMINLAVDTSPNNITRSVTKYTYDNNIHLITTTYEYTYRLDGYPEKVIEKSSNDNIIKTITYKYNN